MRLPPPYLQRVLVRLPRLGEGRGRGGAEAVVGEVDERHLTFGGAHAGPFPRPELQTQGHSQPLQPRRSGGVVVVVVVVVHHRVVERLWVRKKTSQGVSEAEAFGRERKRRTYSSAGRQVAAAEEEAALMKTILDTGLIFYQLVKKKHRNQNTVWVNLLLARLGSLVGLAMPESIPRTSGGSMGFPKYRLTGSRQESGQI